MTSSRWLFAGAVFLGSFLLFLVEPIAAKQLLPLLGGSAAVWITCLVFFQTALLAAYLYAHWLLSKLPTGFSPPSALARCGSGHSLGSAQLRHRLGADHPIAAVFVALDHLDRPPFFMLGTTSPLCRCGGPG